MKIGQYGELICPQCDGGNLHQAKAVTEWRFREDSDGLRTMSEKGKANTELVESRNINGRRDNIYITFNCENGHAVVMRIQQHKGTTYIKWKN